ncbi:MAG: helix-turn-helix transcriptional regulator [Planctomycetota bacterium]
MSNDYSRKLRPPSKPPSDREAVILQILSTGGLRGRYGLEIRELYELQSNRGMPLGSLYTTLKRMEAKGYLASEMGESTHERGGNRRKYFRIEAPGIKALRAFEDLIRERASMTGLVVG